MQLLFEGNTPKGVYTLSRKRSYFHTLYTALIRSLLWLQGDDGP